MTSLDLLCGMPSIVSTRGVKVKAGQLLIGALLTTVLTSSFAFHSGTTTTSLFRRSRHVVPAASEHHMLSCVRDSESSNSIAENGDVVCASVSNKIRSDCSGKTLSSAPALIPTKVRANMLASAIMVSTFASFVPTTLTPVTSAAAAAQPIDLTKSSPTVSTAISNLRDAAASPNSREELFRSYEAIADIITEGKGVGGSISYRGVQLERGYVADEDTTIYNPGLTLLTESEKSQLVQAIVESRASALNRDGAWGDDNQLAYEFLKDKLDPFHITELRGYFQAFPVLVGVAYAVNLAVQQIARDLFPISYGLGVAIVILPALALLAVGPPS